MKACGWLLLAAASAACAAEEPNLDGYAKTESLATVATSGSYGDLTDKPALFSGSFRSLATTGLGGSTVRPTWLGDDLDAAIGVLASLCALEGPWAVTDAIPDHAAGARHGRLRHRGLTSGNCRLAA